MRKGRKKHLSLGVIPVPRAESAPPLHTGSYLRHTDPPTHMRFACGNGRSPHIRSQAAGPNSTRGTEDCRGYKAGGDLPPNLGNVQDSGAGLRRLIGLLPYHPFCPPGKNNEPIILFFVQGTDFHPGMGIKEGSAAPESLREGHHREIDEGISYNRKGRVRHQGIRPFSMFHIILYKAKATPAEVYRQSGQ